jgi:hypothetical protein
MMLASLFIWGAWIQSIRYYDCNFADLIVLLWNESVIARGLLGEESDIRVLKYVSIVLSCPCLCLPKMAAMLLRVMMWYNLMTVYLFMYLLICFFDNKLQFILIIFNWKRSKYDLKWNYWSIFYFNFTRSQQIFQYWCLLCTCHKWRLNPNNVMYWC